jgi:type IV fimbrial biogenesis protein FimT
MTALFIISILTVLAVPLFNSMIQSYRLSATSDNLFHILQYARSEAIKRNTNVYVSFTTGDTWCYGVNLSSACNCSVLNSCGLGTTSYATAQQMSLSATGLSSNSIYFEGSHGAANASGTVTFTAYGQASPLMTITISRMGNTQQCATGVSGYTAC